MDMDRLAAEETRALRERMKEFVQTLVVGTRYAVVVDTGETESCSVVLSPSLLHLHLEMGGGKHSVALRSVKDIFSGRLHNAHLEGIPLDDLCSTLVMRNNQCLTFRLSSLQERDNFTKCLTVLATAID